MRAVRTASLPRAASFPSLLVLLLSLSLSPACAAEEGRGFSSAAGAPSPRPMERSSPSARLVDAIAGMAAAGDWKAAEAALGQARLALPDSSDLLYLSALASLKLRDEVYPALAWLEASLVSGRFEVYSTQDAGDLAASLLIRLRRYDEALGLLSSLPEAVQPSRGLDPEYRRLRALAFLGLGKRASALAELRAGADRFPADPRFARLFFDRFAAAAPLPAERDLADLFLGRLELLSAQDAELPLLAIPFMVLPSDRENTVRAARAVRVQTPRASLLGLEYGLIGDEAAVKEFFSGFAAGQAEGEGPAHGGSRASGSELAALSGLLGTEAGRAAFSAALSAFSGSIFSDRDGDGFPEEEARYGSGLLEAWSLDSDQDGRPEVSVACREGVPASCALRRPEASIDIEYSRYPYASRIAFLDGADGGAGGAAASYRFGPSSFPFAPLGLRPFPDAKSSPIFLASPLPAALPTERAVAGAALEIDYREGDILNVVSLDRGIPLRRESFRAGKILSVTTYEKGLPRREMRDSDGDGRFETDLIYLSAPGPSDSTGPSAPESPARSVARIDADGDGIFEYSEANFPPYRKEWDLDRNGSVDAVQLAIDSGPAAGGSRREFASRLDGRFDEVLVCDSGGRILSFTREGKALALVQDSNPALRWIGAKPFDLGSNLPAADGVYNYMNARYRLVVLPSGSFAEVLP